MQPRYILVNKMGCYTKYLFFTVYRLCILVEFIGPSLRAAIATYTELK